MPLETRTKVPAAATAGASAIHDDGGSKAAKLSWTRARLHTCLQRTIRRPYRLWAEMMCGFLLRALVSFTRPSCHSIRAVKCLFLLLRLGEQKLYQHRHTPQCQTRASFKNENNKEKKITHIYLYIIYGEAGSNT